MGIICVRLGQMQIVMAVDAQSISLIVGQNVSMKQAL